MLAARSYRRLYIAGCLILLGISSHPVSTADGEDLAAQLQPLIDAHPGTVAVAVKHLTTGEEFAYQADRPMPTASLIKWPLLIAAYGKIERGDLSLDQMIQLQEADKVPGSGILSDHFSAGTALSLHDAMHLMIVFSDNTATNLVANAVELHQVSDDMMALGCPETKLHSLVFRRDTSIFPERSEKYGLGSTTAHEMVLLFEKLHRRELVSADACEKMLQHLLACKDRTKIGRHIPADVPFAHKTGEIVDCKTDAGLILTPRGPIAICVLTNENQDHRWGDDNPANVLCAEIGRRVYAYFQPDDESPAPSGNLKMGSQGELVENLQRTLNVRLDPSPGLSVDGDFGPNTQQAVIRFQAEHGLATSGEVTGGTWEALGTLLTQDRPVSPPDVVNAERLPRAPPDPRDGPPFVTAKAWAILDGATGNLLDGLEQDTPREMASTTKMLTAYVALQFVRQDPSVLQETVTFSRRADDTEGSTSGVRAGEALTVDDLMYGLLLPSGNDASVAIGEHFGEKIPPKGHDDRRSKYVRFVARMNETAHELGMSKSKFQNTHGLPHPEHVATAGDLGRLAWFALQDANFRRYVNTPQRGCTLIGPGGYQRNVVWTNTNQLLKIEGYDGVKTGTTDAAGACLVARGERDGQSRIVVILGSVTSDARYVDIRNLFRWSWTLDPAHPRIANQAALHTNP